MFNLVNILPEEDKKLIAKYVEKYGVFSHFIGADEWLKNWGREKIKLYKMLNNSFIYSIPISYKKPEEEYKRQIIDLGVNNFVLQLNSFVDNYIFTNEEIMSDGEKLQDVKSFYYQLFRSSILLEGKTNVPLKIKLSKNKNTLQISAGTKIMKAIYKFLNYFKPYLEDNEEYKQILIDFENFRLKHSQILNDNMINGSLVFSIHPLDFMTMSDNDSNWHSCMSWVEKGCYRIGTVEMMNSNNVICCYVINKKGWNFLEDESTGEKYSWNNKKWRQLVYVTPEIIMTGKSYPYSNKELSYIILEELRKLAKNNLKLDYEYGIEEYQDMKYINSTESMERARSYRMLPKSAYHKRNILFDTKGMYNDVLNDHGTNYWCIRNKVKKTTVISVSGKAPCLCCGQDVITPTYNWDVYRQEHYNERYQSTSEVICKDCDKKYFYCEKCGDYNHISPTYSYYDEAQKKTVHICEDCIKNIIKKCPCCNKIINIHRLGRDNAESMTLRYINNDIDPILIPLHPNLNPEEYTHTTSMFPSTAILKMNSSGINDYYLQHYQYYCIFGHLDCIEKELNLKAKEFNFKPFRPYFANIESIYTKIFPYKEDKKCFEKFFLSNLQGLTKEDIENNTLFEKL